MSQFNWFITIIFRTSRSGYALQATSTWAILATLHVLSRLQSSATLKTLRKFLNFNQSGAKWRWGLAVTSHLNNLNAFTYFTVSTCWPFFAGRCLFGRRCETCRRSFVARILVFQYLSVNFKPVLKERGEIADNADCFHNEKTSFWGG